MAPAAALGPEIYARGFRFSPTPQEAVTYYLPRLVSGDPQALHEIVRPVIHRADVYACDPADLARRFRPMPRTHNRFFFTGVKKGARVAGPGSWAGQSTVEIKDKEGVQIGQLKKFRYRKHAGGVFTDWLMEEYSSCDLDGIIGSGGGGMQFVLCKVYVSPKAALNSDAYKESAAFSAPMLPPATPDAIAQPAPAKRPTPPQDAMPPCAKRMCCQCHAVQPAPPPRPPAPTLSSHTAVRKMPFAPPQPSPLRRGLTTPLVTVTQPSFASAPPPAPPAPARPALQPRGSAMPLPTPPRPPAQQVPPLPTTTSAASARHMPQQAPAPSCLPQVLVQPKQRRTIIDPFEAAILRGRAEAEDQTEEMVTAPPAKLQEEDDDDFAKVLDNMLSAEADEQSVTAAPIKLQEEDDDGFANLLDDMLSAEAEEAALEFDVDDFFNFSEEDLEASMAASSSPCHQGLMLA